jgi:glycosyltransferase involved in cell wall biosynthesis
VIPNLLPFEMTQARERNTFEPRVLWMRTFHPIYRPELALEAFALLRSERVEATLTMAGQDKGWLQPLTELAAELNIEDCVVFPGFAGPEMKTELFNEHDLFLNTSAIDNYPVSLLEAAAAGLVVVSSDVGGIPAVFVDRKEALLVRDADPTKLAEAMNEVLDDIDLAMSISRGGSSKAVQCSWGKVGPLWHDLLFKITGMDSSS